MHNNDLQTYQTEINESEKALAKIGTSVVVFGSSAIQPSTTHYNTAVETGRILAEAGYAVITGGGPGLMEAVNKGATQANGKSVGICMKFPGVFIQNEYITPQYNLTLTNMAARKQIFWDIASAFVVLPGGFGTLDEVTECMTLMQMKKIAQRPIIFQDKMFWMPATTWIKHVLRNEYKVIGDNDLAFMHLAESPEQTLNIIRKKIEQK